METPLNVETHPVPMMPVQKSNVGKIVAAVIITAVVVGGLMYLLLGANNDSSPVSVASSTPSETATPSSDPTAEWKTYTNVTDKYSIQYPDPYRVWLEHNLVNYNGDDPQYERGNPNGVKIQIQNRTLSNGQTFTTVMSQIGTNQTGDVNEETKAQSYVLGDVRYTNKTSGPGGDSDVFYVPGDSRHYYVILVWNIENDSTTVHQILSTFKFTK